ncbi:hypothetical protein [Ruminococcus flavefaciens]|uniref:hypothetical protein n=1 Tax=Ruminococcus flavefaciens TaxID=1265 RepID=UPI00048AECCE|nr:hypothetical protein [Ruminococcus flavefaciens]
MESIIDMFTVMIFLGGMIMLILGIDWGWYSDEPKRKIKGKVIFAVSLIICVSIIYLWIKCIAHGSVLRTCC